MSPVLYVILAIVLILIILIINIYNNLVKARLKVKNSWSQINIQLQRRFDLIPNLVETVKGYMMHEGDVLTKVTNLRTAWSAAKTNQEKINLDNQLSDTLKTVFAVSENYPELKANDNFLALQGELKITEDKICYARQFYNDTVTKYNTKLETVPSNIIASAFGFKPEKLIETENDEARKNVKVDFS